MNKTKKKKHPYAMRSAIPISQINFIFPSCIEKKEYLSTISPEISREIFSLTKNPRC